MKYKKVKVLINNIEKEIIMGVYDNIDAYSGTINDETNYNKYKAGSITSFVEPVKATDIFKLLRESDTSKVFPMTKGGDANYEYIIRVKNNTSNYLKFNFKESYNPYNDLGSIFTTQNWSYINNSPAFRLTPFNYLPNDASTNQTLKFYLCIDKNDNLFLINWGRIFTYHNENYTLRNNMYTYASFSNTKSNLNANTFFANSTEDVTRYPTSGEDDGIGFIDNESDNIDFPTVLDFPIDIFTNTYKMTKDSLGLFKAELFSDGLADIIKKWWNKTMDCIVSLSIAPLGLSEYTNTEFIKVGTHTMNTKGLRITNCLYEVDCGYIDIKEYYGNFIDYEQTIIQCYVPFVGFIPLKTVDVMGARLTLKYIVNLITGCFNAYINVQRDRFDVDFNSCIYETTGNMFTQIPVTSPDFSRIIQSAINTIVSGATTVATGGASYLIGSQVLQGAQNMLNSSPTIQRSGNFDKNASICAIKKPFVLIERPRIAIPKNFESKKGFMSNFSSKLSELKGYTEVSYINMDNLDIPKNCIDELKNILTTGVIL